MAGRTLSLGLVGLGPWGRNYVRTIEGLPRARLTATATRDWRDLIGGEPLDGIIVSTPPATHGDIAIAAIEAGIPVMIEKPLALSLAVSREILECAKRHRGRVLVDHIHLFHPAWRELKRRAATLGPVRSLRGNYGDHGPFRNDTPALWDWGPHPVALCLDLMGARPTEVAARRLRSAQTAEGLGEQFMLSLSFDGGAAASVEIGNLANAKQRSFEAGFESCALVMDAVGDKPLVMRPKSGDETVIEVSPDLPLTMAVNEFLDMIEADGPDLTGLELAVDVVETLERCERALAG